MPLALPKYTLWPCGLFLILLCGAVFLVAAFKSHRNKEFATASLSSSGQVIRKFERVNNGARGGPTHVPCLVYIYDVGNHFYVSDETEVSWDTGSVVKLRDHIPVRYLIRDHAQSRIDLPPEAERARMEAVSRFVLGLIFLTGGGFFLAYWWNKNRRWHRLVEKGEKCIGIVESVEICNLGKSRGAMRYLIIEFTDSQGAQVRGRTWDLSWFKQRHWKMAESIYVYHDRKSSRIFTVDLDHKPAFT